MEGDPLSERPPEADASDRITPSKAESAQEGFWIAERSEDVVARCMQITGVEATT